MLDWLTLYINPEGVSLFKQISRYKNFWIQIKTPQG
jgi:hypothetical protein